MFRHVLIPTDGSARSRKAARAAIAFAKAMGAKVTAYHGLEMNPSYFGGDGMALDPSLLDTIEKQARKQAQKYVTDVAKAARTAGVACETYVTKPALSYEGVISAAKKRKCDVIFMASHGRGELASLILGSVTQKVLAHSKLPVVVYR